MLNSIVWDNVEVCVIVVTATAERVTVLIPEAMIGPRHSVQSHRLHSWAPFSTGMIDAARIEVLLHTFVVGLVER